MKSNTKMISATSNTNFINIKKFEDIVIR